MAKETINIPDLGGADGVEIIEVCVAVGDTVAAEDSLLVLESDKASMEVPAPKAGTISKILVKVGDSVSEGDAIFELEAEGEQSADSGQPEASAPVEDAPAAEPVVAQQADTPVAASSAGTSSVQSVAVPDIGGEAEVIELCVAEGDSVEEGDSLVVLESDKASMEVPAPQAGIVRKFLLKVGDNVGKDTPLCELEVQGGAAPAPAAEAPAAQAPAKAAEPAAPAAAASPAGASPTVTPQPDVHAGPAVRKMAREFGIPLEAVTGTGPKGRIVKEDLQAYVKQLASKPAAAAAQGGSGLPALPEVDFSRFGPTRVEPRSKLEKLTASNMHRNWVSLPHVTQFDDADITELEVFRKSLKAEAEKRGVKATPLPFLLKAVAAALRANPLFNASLSSDGENLILKDYVNVGMAVDTPAGLMVPVIRDVDQKSIWDLAAETAELAAKARDRKLKPAEMQGGCFTISSLGNIGGNGFTPIINYPELAILGVSRLTVKPVWDGKAFQPREMLPLALSYDHRAINGGDAGRFMTYLTALLADIRRVLL